MKPLMTQKSKLIIICVASMAATLALYARSKDNPLTIKAAAVNVVQRRPIVAQQAFSLKHQEAQLRHDILQLARHHGKKRKIKKKLKKINRDHSISSRLERLHDLYQDLRNS